MVRRHDDNAFMGGAHVFPGGRVDAGDRDAAGASWCDGIDAAAARLGDLPAAEAVAFYVAAARELFEEAGVLLAKPDTTEDFKQYRAEVHTGSLRLREVIEREHLRLALDALVPFAHWLTPPVDVRRFDTRFFMTRVPPDQTPAHDETETTDSAWLRPAEALTLAANDDIILPPPTWTTLRELERFRSVEDALAWARQRRIVRRAPLALERHGERMLVLPGDPLHPEPAGGEPFAETRFLLRGRRWRAVRPAT